jgi:hypothetical protein
MKTSTKGRPVKNTNATIKVTDLTVEFLSAKANDYEQTICYFKLIDPLFKTKAKPLLVLTDPDLKIPLWKTEDKGEYLLKVNEKWIGSSSDLVPKQIYNINCKFEYYSMDKDHKTLKGYYCKISKIKKLGSDDEDVEVEQQDEH